MVYLNYTVYGFEGVRFVNGKNAMLKLATKEMDFTAGILEEHYDIWDDNGNEYKIMNGKIIKTER